LERIPITRSGYEALKAELERIKKIDRPQNILAIEEARAHGDLSENAEYAAAKDRQQFINARISELEFKIASVDIIDPSNLPRDRVVFGSRVLLENTETGEGVEYQLVGNTSWSVPTNRTSRRGAYRYRHRWGGPSSANVRTMRLPFRRPAASGSTSWWKFFDSHYTVSNHAFFQEVDTWQELRSKIA